MTFCTWTKYQIYQQNFERYNSCVIEICQLLKRNTPISSEPDKVKTFLCMWDHFCCSPPPKKKSGYAADHLHLQAFRCLECFRTIAVLQNKCMQQGWAPLYSSYIPNDIPERHLGSDMGFFFFLRWPWRVQYSMILFFLQRMGKAFICIGDLHREQLYQTIFDSSILLRVVKGNYLFQRMVKSSFFSEDGKGIYLNNYQSLTIFDSMMLKLVRWEERPHRAWM